MSVADTPFVTASDPAPAIMRVGSVLRVPVVSADPASGDDGEIVYDQVLDKFRVRVNGAWADIGGGGGGCFRPAERLPEPARHGGFNRRRRRFDEFALLTQPGENFLARDTEFLSQLVYAGLTCHYLLHL